MNILVIVGSKQLEGNTDLLADSFIEGAKQARHSVEKIHLRKYMVNPCLGCNMCHKTTGPCIQNDDMGAIYDAFKKSDMIVFATPLYFSTISSSLKCVIDRFYALTNQNSVPMPKKEVALLATANENSSDTFYHVSSYYKTVFLNTLRWVDRGMVLAGGCGGGALAPKCIKETNHLEAAKKFGSSLR